MISKTHLRYVLTKIFGKDRVVAAALAASTAAFAVAAATAKTTIRSNDMMI
jgi:hypothetical protein